MVERNFRVIVIGGGHAGLEAAWAAANLLPEAGSVALVTIDPARIGVMSCNPAIGGLAKGQIVREIDALGGLMGLVADATGIHFKVLNTSKGPAVHGPRSQNDKHAYARTARAMIAARPEIEVIAGTVEGVVLKGDRLMGVEVLGLPGEAGRAPVQMRLSAAAAVLTTGTFMRGLMHTGESRTPGGRVGEAAAQGISARLIGLGFELGRLKTGTPPRLRRGSIEWGALAEQRGDECPVAFSPLSEGLFGRFPVLKQVDCRQTQTAPEAHELIRANLHRAPMYSGQIESVGPRYCPSIEDKVVRFPDRTSHGVFLEPESLESDWIYCNGISSSLPADVQDVVVRTMPGCGRAEILQYGYAVEYDMVRPHQIGATGQTKRVEGLFLAGQINGTSGYEEAAAQGWVAGVNAARLARGQAADVTLGRDSSYIGVLMDDLVTKTPVEPYRMFTSRAEHRLMLRADNAADRLTPLAERIGLLEHTELGAWRRAHHRQRRAELERIAEAAAGARLDGESIEHAAGAAGFTVERLRAALPGVCAGEEAWRTAWADLRYGPYVRRQQAEVRRHAAMEHRRIPAAIDFTRIDGLGAEARQALARFRPQTFGQAGRLEGVTPADLTLVLVHLGRGRGGPGQAFGGAEAVERADADMDAGAGAGLGSGAVEP